MHFTIVSYTFPPSKEIGGRRWAKFSQQLFKNGHQVTVVCAKSAEDNNWYKAEFSGIDVHVLPKYYPEWLNGVTKSLKEKVLYRLYTKVFSLFTKQNYFDKGYSWRKPMLAELEKINKSNPIEVLVVTGAPFSLLLYGAEFKLRHKEIIYISDFRDPWTWGTYYGIPDLTPRKLMFQKFSEKKAIELSDMVCFPTEHMGKQLNIMYPDFISKFYILPHAYDPERFPSDKEETERNGFIYGGTLYDGIDGYIKRLIEILKKYPESGFRWDIFTGTTYPLLDKDKAPAGIIKHALISEELLFKKIKSSSAYLAFFPHSDKDLISTKFFEIIYTRTPILFIGEEGDVGKFIRENKLGVHILPENMEHELPKYLNGKVPFEYGYFDVTKYSFSAVTDKFIEQVKRVKNESYFSNLN